MPSVDVRRPSAPDIEVSPMQPNGIKQRHVASNANSAKADSAASNAAEDNAAATKITASTSLPRGTTSDGTQFIVPDTHNTLATFDPRNFNAASLLSASLVALNLFSMLYLTKSRWPHILVFAFWRCCYDVGLGLILQRQSSHEAFARWYRNAMEYYAPESFQHRLLVHLAKSQLVDKSLNVNSLPSDFRAWLVYKNFVNVILVNDASSYLLLGVRCANLPSSISILLLGQYALGIGLCFFNYWAKVDAHRCIGEYCWYWGDFFYQKHQTLTFDGIFELFPHPMYTVGYSLYYGYSLLLRSYTMLYVSLLAHAMQMLFLTLVEQPHIDKLYGGNDKSAQKQLESSPDYIRSPVFFFNLELPYNATSVLLVAVSCYICLWSALCEHASWFLVLHVLVWRCFHWIGLGSVLWQQSRRHWWTKMCQRRYKHSPEQAFELWKQLYNASQTINAVAFATCALKHMTQSTWRAVFTPNSLMCITLGVVCCLLCAWSCWSTYDVIGEFGYFYGDFFLTDAITASSSNSSKNNGSGVSSGNHLSIESSTPEPFGPKSPASTAAAHKRQLCFTGIYRHLNNPDMVTGYAASYGLALISQSYTILALALTAHLLNIGFINLVEVPHQVQLYPQVREAAPLEKALRAVADKVVSSERQREIERRVSRQAREVKMKALRQVHEMYKQMRREQKASGTLFEETPRSSRATTPTRRSPFDAASLAARRRSSEKDIPATVNELSLPASSSVSTQDGIVKSPSPSSKQLRSLTNGAYTELHCEERASLHNPLTVHYSTNSEHADSDWIGLYNVEIPSVPGASEGRWLYVTKPGPTGSVTFDCDKMPRAAGVYEVRYHRANRYSVRASTIVLLEDEAPQSPTDRPQPANSSSKTQ